jgi:hypothetical protein
MYIEPSLYELLRRIELHTHLPVLATFCTRQGGGKRGPNPNGCKVDAGAGRRWQTRIKKYAGNSPLLPAVVETKTSPTLGHYTALQKRPQTVKFF